MKYLVLSLCFALPEAAQIFGGNAGGTGAPNPYTYTAGASTSSAVDITSLNATNDRSLLAQCWTASGPVAITSWSTSGGPPLTTATLNYASTSGVGCRVNNTGGAGVAGPMGLTGPPPDLTVGMTTTSAPGSSANVVRSGPDSAPVFSFSIPRGDVGATGQKGDKGDKGDTVVGSSIGVDFTNQPSATIAHNWGSLYYSTECVDTSGEVLRPAGTNKTTNAMTWYFFPNASGSCSVTSGGGGSGGSYTLPTASNSVLGGVKVGTGLDIDGNGFLSATGNGSMVYPGAGVPQSTGVGWGSSLAVGVLANNLMQLNGSAQIPAVSGALLTALNASALNSGTVPAARLGSGTADGTTCLHGNGTWAACASVGGSGVVDGTSLLGAGTEGDPMRVNPLTVPTRISTTASLTYATFGGDGNCQENTITLAGAATGDVPTVGLPSTFPMGIIVGGVYVSAANTVVVKLCRLGGTATISGSTFTVQIVRSF